jgi:hypothetical protein
MWTIALRLCMTEMTIALPIAFKHAHRAGVLNGARAAVLSLLMLTAYLWRMLWSGHVSLPPLTPSPLSANQVAGGQGSSRG